MPSGFSLKGVSGLFYEENIGVCFPLVLYQRDLFPRGLEGFSPVHPDYGVVRLFPLPVDRRNQFLTWREVGGSLLQGEIASVMIGKGKRGLVSFGK